MLKTFYLLFYIMIKDLNNASNIDCIKEQTISIIVLAVPPRLIFCQNNMPDPSLFPYGVSVFLPGFNEAIYVVAQTDIYQCPVGCRGCWADTENECFECSSLTRGTKPRNPTFSEFVLITLYSCPCRDNYIDIGVKDCQCPDGFYTKRSEVDDYTSCERCPRTYGTCIYTSGTIILLTCAVGIGRSTDIATQCPCQIGYYDDMIQVDCVQICNKPCATCISGSGTACATCIDPLMDLVNINECQCQSGYYLEIQGNDQICQACHSSCLTCDFSSSDHCLTCDSSIQRSYSSGQCLCPQYFASQIFPECVGCDDTCLTCVDQDSCSTCFIDSNRYIQNLGDFCTCSPGFAENPSNSLCVACPISYATCIYDAENITPLACAIGIGRTTSIANLCTCEIGYQDVLDQIDCAPCSKPCAVCVEGSETACATCIDPLMDLVNINECLCQSGYYLDIQGNDYTCQACHSSCLTCDFSSQDRCLTCDSLIQRTFNSGQCLCPQYYASEIFPDCVRCDYNCLTCINQDSCATCLFGSNREVVNFGDLCTCQSGYGEDPSISECVVCHYSCLTCLYFYYSCTGCPAGSNRQLIENNCNCLVRYYDIEQIICEQCHYTCLTCSGSDELNCLTCDIARFRIKYENVCVCEQGYGYVDLNTELCQVCDPFCLTCDQISICLTCDSLLHRILSGLDECLCGDGYYQYNSQCSQCHYTCQTCSSEDFDSCLSCDLDLGRTLLINLLQQSCPCTEGYFDTSTKQCKQCYYQCLLCFNEYSNGCLTCDASRIFLNSQCLCPLQSIDDGYSIACTVCHYSCLTCSGLYSSDCLTCYDNSLISTTVSRIYQYSECKCPNRWYDNSINENCQQCHKSCYTCFKDTQYSCISCQLADHRIPFSNSCFCQEGYLENPLSFICDKCDYRCSNCNVDITNCLTCPVGSLRNIKQQPVNLSLQTCGCTQMAPHDQQDNPVCQTCHYTCYNCSDQGEEYCTICDVHQNRFLSIDNGSYCKCLEGYYTINIPECEACSPYCKECIIAQDFCISCNPAYFRELQGSQCLCGIRINQNLSYYDVQDPQCLVCHYSCYKCNGKSYDQCLECSTHIDLRYLLDSQCECIPGYLDNGLRVCQKCYEKCLTCELLKIFCLSCPVGSLRVLNIFTQSCDCTDGYYDSVEVICQLCHINCDNCQSRANKCLSCKDFSNRIYNYQLYTCNCQSGYYDLGNGICSECHFSCGECYGPLDTNCTSCPNFQITSRVLKSEKCVCRDRYFDNFQSQICQPCAPTCYTCKDTQLICLLCQSGQFRSLTGNDCQCQVGYFDSGNIVCEQCSSNCQECLNTKNQCSKCSGNIILNVGVCICDNGYFDDGFLQCQICDSTCLTCQNTSHFCTSCNPSYFRLLNVNQCICKYGFLDTGLPSCLACDTRCQSCQTQINQCISCDLLQNRILFGTTCRCNDGFYENSTQTCSICDISCQTCIGQGNYCITCYSQLNVNNLNQCQCEDGTFNNSNNICQQCYQKCKTCKSSPTNCLDCSIDKQLVLNNCHCNDGYYDSGATLCQICSYQCATCNISQNHCVTCNLVSNRTLEGLSCVCQQGYYDSGSIMCFQCNTTCQTCSISSQNCTSCDSSLQRIQINNECICSPGYFHNGIQQCQLCHYTCLECVLQATSCTQCDIALTFRIDRSINYSKCPCQKGFYDDGTSICKQCYYNCIDCLQTATNCIVCNNNLAFSRINLIPDCICQDGYFDDGIQPVCQKCNTKCQTCVADSTNCLICESPLTRKSVPKCECIDGSYINNEQKCSKCAVKCLTCITDSQNCSACQPDRMTKQCLCQDGYYEANILVCQQCSPKCSKCLSDKLNCITCKIDRVNPPNCVCKQHYYDNFINNECQECNQYCGRCDFNGCIDCAANRLLLQNTCICPINSISYTDTPWCSTCSFARVTGMFSDDLTTIIYTFEKPILFNFPHKVDIQEYCQYVVSNKSISLLGQSPLCTIVNNTFLIEIGDGATTIVDDEIEFNSDLLKHQNCNLTITTIINTIINPPINLIRPIIKVIYPEQISPCQQMQIGITYQSINGKRNLVLEWLSPLNLNSIQVANQQQFQTLTIESGELPQNSIIDIQLHFTNFLNQSDQLYINFTTLSSSTPQFNFLTTKTQFISWSPIKLMVYFENKICPGGISQILNNEIRIEFMELTEMRSANALPMKFSETLFIITDSQAFIQTIIPSRTLSINSNYSIVATFIDLKNNQNLQSQFIIQILRSPLMVQIIGGTRVQNYLKKFEIKIQTKDPDLQEQWNQDNDIKVEVKCFDVQTNQLCVVDNKTLKLNSSYIQEIAPRMFNPFSVIIISVVAKKGSMNGSYQATIIFLDADLPILNVTYPSGYSLREVNINEKLQFEAPQQTKNISYSYSLIYDYEVVYLKNVNSELIKFAIWDNFNKFKFINKITVRILAHDIQFLMPRVCSISLNVNLPPINSIITISPQFGNSFFTNYGIKVTNSRDKDQPIQYRFAYYQSQVLYDNDIRGGLNNLIILQDYSTIQQYSGFLESGDLIMLVSVADSQGSIVNYTNNIKSLDFYDQLSNSSMCQDFVLSIGQKTYTQEVVMVLTKEFIKLYEKDISVDCKQQIGTILKKYKDDLFDFLLSSSNVIMMSRLSNILSQLYQLQLTQIRVLNELDSDICFNTTSKFIQFSKFSGILYLNDSVEQINKIKVFSTQIEKSILQNQKLIQYHASILDIGDDQAERNIEQNILQRKMFIKLLEALYQQVYSQRPIIRNLINNILNSLQINLDKVDEQGIKIKTSNVGVQINKISQKRYNKFIILDQIDPEFEDLVNFTITRFIQISKYPSNYNLENKSFQLEMKETTKYIYIKSVELFDISLFDPFIYVLQANNIIRVEKIFQGRLNFNFDESFNICDSNTSQQENSNYTIVCSNFRNQKWNINECLTSQSLDKYGNVVFSCLCNYVNPITLMILNITNITKAVNNQDIYIQIEDLINLKFPTYLIGIIIISIFLCLSLIAKLLRQYRVNLYKMKQNYEIFKIHYPLPLTQQPHMSNRLFTKNLRYLHQFTRIFYIQYIHLTTFEQILLFIFTINSIFALIQLYSALISPVYIAILLTIISSLAIEIVVKILEGFFNGPKVLKIIGYIILVNINLGMLFINVTAHSQNLNRNIVLSIILMVLIIGPIETLIQYIRLNLAFIVFKELEQNPLDPLLNFGYYFIQDEVLIFLIDGVSIFQLI